MHDAVIVSAVRTAVGKAPKGALSTVRPDEMAATVIAETLRRFFKQRMAGHGGQRCFLGRFPDHAVAANNGRSSIMRLAGEARSLASSSASTSLARAITAFAKTEAFLLFTRGPLASRDWALWHREHGDVHDAPAAPPAPL